MGNSDRRELARVATDFVRHIAASIYYNTVSRLGNLRAPSQLLDSRSREANDAR